MTRIDFASYMVFYVMFTMCVIVPVALFLLMVILVVPAIFIEKLVFYFKNRKRKHEKLLEL